MLRSINGCCLITSSLQELWSIFTNSWQFRCPVFSRWQTSGWQRTAGIQATSLRSGSADAHLEATTSCRHPTQKWSEPGCGKSPGSCGTRPSGTEVSFLVTCVQCGTIKPSGTEVLSVTAFWLLVYSVDHEAISNRGELSVCFLATCLQCGTINPSATFLCCVALLSHHKGELLSLLPYQLHFCVVWHC